MDMGEGSNGGRPVRVSLMLSCYVQNLTSLPRTNKESKFGKVYALSRPTSVLFSLFYGGSLFSGGFSGEKDIAA